MARELEGVALVQRGKERKQKVKRHKVQVDLEPMPRDTRAELPQSSFVFHSSQGVFIEVPVFSCLAAGLFTRFDPARPDSSGFAEVNRRVCLELKMGICCSHPVMWCLGKAKVIPQG